jgi:phosphinothricin acetyltransferase
MDDIRFEEMREEYLDEVAAIYAHYILNTTVTFHMHVLSRDEMRALVFYDDPRHQAFVIRCGGEICGYVILEPYRAREAYALTAEVAVYLKPEYTGKGIGSRAIVFIEDVAKRHGLHVLIAAISGDNDKSLRMFAKNGYSRCAHYKEVGRKFGKWLDVVVYQKIIS